MINDNQKIKQTLYTEKHALCTERNINEKNTITAAGPYVNFELIIAVADSTFLNRTEPVVRCFLSEGCTFAF
jgi:hypothetical protein